MKLLDKDGLSYFWAKLKTLLNGKLDADAVSSTGTASTGWNNCRLSGGKIQYYNTNTTYSAATTSSSGLMSANDKTKLDGIETGAEANVQADWNAVSGAAEILNKPTLGAAAACGVDTAPASGSTNLITSGAVYTVVGDINTVLEEVL